MAFMVGLSVYVLNTALCVLHSILYCFDTNCTTLHCAVWYMFSIVVHCVVYPRYFTVLCSMSSIFFRAVWYALDIILCCVA